MVREKATYGLSPGLKKMIEDDAAERGMTASKRAEEYIDRGRGFDDDFVNTMKRVAKEYGMQWQTITENFTVFAVSLCNVQLKHLGRVPAFHQAFRMDPRGGFVRGDDLAALIEQDLDQVMARLYEMFRASVEEQKPVVISKDEVGTLLPSLVKEEQDG